MQILADTAERLELGGKDFKISFNKTTGFIDRFEAKGELLLSEGPVPQFARAYMSTDGWNRNAWTTVDRNLPTPQFESAPSEDGRAVAVNITYPLTVIDSTSFVDMHYTVYCNGAVRVDTSLRTQDNSQLYRFGADLVMPEGFETVTWFTKGPFENFNDRMTGSYMGQYTTTVTEDFTDYMKPQHSGSHQDTRWMALSGDDKAASLLVVATGGQHFEANAQHFKWRDLVDQRHLYQVHPREETILSVNYASRGTGGQSTGPETLPQYRLPAGNYSYSYTLVPFKQGEDVNAVSKFYMDDVQFKTNTFSLTAAVENDAIKAELNYTSGADKPCRVILGIYDGSGRLVYTDIADITAKPNTQNSVVFTPDTTYKGNAYKVFAWEELNPLCKPAEGIYQ